MFCKICGLVEGEKSEENGLVDDISAKRICKCDILHVDKDAVIYCKVCGIVDGQYDENSGISHENSTKHKCNVILADYKHKKRNLSGNRDGIIIIGKAHIVGSNEPPVQETGKARKIEICKKPNEVVKFVFDIRNDMREQDATIVGIQLGHPQPEFIMSNHPYKFGEEMHILEKKTKVKEEISVTFRAADVGQHEMAIMFTFNRKKDDSKWDVVIVREMVIKVEEVPVIHAHTKSPYAKTDLVRADKIVRSTCQPVQHKYKVSPELKILFAMGLEEHTLERSRKSDEYKAQLRKVLIETKQIIRTGIVKDNYMPFFHHLLWWEEVIARINLKKYNMLSVSLERRGQVYVLEVPGLAEKRPSLLRRDRVFLQPMDSNASIFECVIKDIDDNYIHLSELDHTFYMQHRPDSRYSVRFIMSRVPLERSHEALAAVFATGHECRLFPERGNIAPPACAQIHRFFNPLISHNQEQRSAVEHIVAGTSGRSPYIVFGPPGTGKTMTIVEAIIQLVVANGNNRILVCTDSNMAADHIALMLLRFSAALNIKNFLLRANSQSREWSTMPAELARVSNGTNYDSFYSVSNSIVAQYRIVVTTLLHAAKYASMRSQSAHRLQMTHLFVDEAAQASEPNTLVPMTGLLARNGRLVLAGDPRQLGPVCMSRDASRFGLGTSLLERLKPISEQVGNAMYKNDPNYITMLRRNFRNHPDILRLPNELFYENELVPVAPLDPLSSVSVLGLAGGERAVVFHALHSKEQRMGCAPSFFNEKELDMLKRYVATLVSKHGVLPQDIGVIAPYIRQVYKMKTWLVSNGYDKIEVGTVEAFQGKEKRVILVSTVRANCGLLDYDAKYQLGFLVDDKRFNVALTRAKAKLIIIGNPTCLSRDKKWRMYMTTCEELNCYYGQENQQMQRTTQLLTEVAITRFNRCRMSNAMHEIQAKKDEQNKNGRNRF